MQKLNTTFHYHDCRRKNEKHIGVTALSENNINVQMMSQGQVSIHHVCC